MGGDRPYGRRLWNARNHVKRSFPIAKVDIAVLREGVVRVEVFRRAFCLIQRRNDYAWVNKTEFCLLSKTRFTLKAQKKSDQSFLSAPARGGMTALGEKFLSSIGG